MVSSDSIRVVVVDDHTLLRESLVSLLRETPGIHVVGQAENGEDGVEVAFRVLPDVVLMDQSMPGISGALATRWIREGAPAVKVIGLSMFEDASTRETMRRAGAVAQFSKAQGFDELVAVIRDVAGRG